MKRTGFKPKVYQRQPPAPLVPIERQVHSGPSERAAVQVAKGVKAKPGKLAPTVDEQRWMDAIVVHGCIACQIDNPLRITAPAVHHILRGGRRLGHRFTLPLCDPGHHQGGKPFNIISRHPYKARFEARYGAEDSLLRELCAALGWGYPG